jgi:hypothetical protein
MDSWNEKQISMMRAGGNDKCINFLTHYKHNYGVWPSVDCSGKIELQYIYPKHRTPIHTLSKSLVVDTIDLDYLSFLSVYTNLNILGILDFKYSIELNKIHLDLKAFDLIDKPVVDQEILNKFTILTLNGLINE